MRWLIDPTGELDDHDPASAAALVDIDGKTIALLDIAKPRGDVFLDRVDELLRARGARTERFQKDSYARVADADLRARIAERCHAVIEALAD